jgi:signal peptidase I
VSAPTTTADRAETRPPKSPARGAVEWVVIIVAAVLAAFLVKTFLVQAFYIPSASMEHTLEESDRILVNKLSYRLHDVHRGDIVVFKRPPSQTGEIKDLIKRVVALPGETVEGRGDSKVYVNGKPVDEPYVSSETAPFEATTVPPDHIWVMGDNRQNSTDSRRFGSIPESRIVGRAFVRVWPVDALSFL